LEGKTEGGQDGLEERGADDGFGLVGEGVAHVGVVVLCQTSLNTFVERSFSEEYSLKHALKERRKRSILVSI
jgi:hypothetical protein